MQQRSGNRNSHFFYFKEECMKEKIIEAVGNRLDKLEVWIDDVRLTREGTEETLEIVLDSKDMIDLQKVVMATRIINPILDKIDLIDHAYTLDVYAKEKGVEKDA